MRWPVLGILAMAVVLRGESVAFRLEHGYPVVEQVYLNGQGPFHFLLDTGAQSTMIKSTAAVRLGLQPSYRVELVTAAGRQHVPAGKARVTLGTSLTAEVEVLWGEPLLRVDGVLGQNVLAELDYLLDHKNRRLAWMEQPPTGEKLPLQCSAARPAFAAQAGGQPVRIVPDSGADRLVLFRPVPGVRVEQNGRMTTHSGFQDLLLGKLTHLRIGASDLCEIPVAVAGGRGTEESALLPAAWFDYVYVNSRAGYAILGPPTKRLRSACRTGPPRLQSLLFP